MHTPIKAQHKKTLPHSLDFQLPDALQCSLPSEMRGIARDEVRLMISGVKGDEVRHSHFYDLAQFLRPGDALVVNTSATLKAALDILDAKGKPLKVHLSNRLGPNRWLVELRASLETKTQRWFGGAVGDIFQLKTGGRLQLLKAYYRPTDKSDHLQLWIAEFYIDQPLDSYLEAYGQPIRYLQAKAGYPADWYQTYFAKEPGSAEMPSAGRAFTERVVKDLEAKGIPIIPLLLHTGVASVEVDERPYEEYYRLSAESAAAINAVREQGGRIIAVGTTVVRALESCVDGAGKVRAGEGMTDLVIEPERGLKVVDGLMTGFHEPRASHLLMLEALAGRKHLAHSYAAAIEEGYYWHEFGDLHLILPAI